MTSDNSSVLKKELEDFKRSTMKISGKINAVGDIWRDGNYASLQSQIGDLAKASRTVIDSGERAVSSINKFFSIAAEEV